jgi:hypothetical protein
MNKFKKNKYTVLKKAVDVKIADFVKNYLLLKRQVAATLIETSNGTPISSGYGQFGDTQVPGSFNLYGDPANDVLLQRVNPSWKKLPV